MQDFCGMCHGSKADPNAIKGMKIFNSMDERKTSSATPGQGSCSEEVMIRNTFCILEGIGEKL
jgi:hypothetical protein